MTVDLPARQRAVPTARVTSAPRLALPGRVDSNNPLAWFDDGATAVLTALSSWGGLPTVARGPSVDALQLAGDAVFVTHPGHGVWFEAVVPDSDGRWYGFYHHERPADDCGRPERQLPRIGLARSADHGTTWEDLGIVLDAPPGTAACDSANRFVLGGVGDVTAVLDHDAQDLFLYFSQYQRSPSQQGVAVARLAWADRDTPAGKVTIGTTARGCRRSGRQSTRRRPRSARGATPPVRRWWRRRGPSTTASRRPTCSGARRFTGTPISSST